VIHPHDQNDDEAHEKRDVGRPQRAQAGPQVVIAVRDADLENEKRDRDRKDAVAEGFDRLGLSVMLTKMLFEVDSASTTPGLGSCIARLAYFRSPSRPPR